MNEEQKNFNEENNNENLGSMSVNNSIPSMGSGELGTGSTSSIHDFMYTEPTTVSNVEIPTESPSFTNVEIPTASNDFTVNYDEPTLASAVPATEMPMTDNMATSNAFLYTEPSTVVEESVGVSSDEDNNTSVSTSPEESHYSQMNFAQNHSVPSKSDTKSNITFMIIFGLVMVAIVFALPYIAGYK